VTTGVATFLSALGVLAPVLFVLALGYCAGRAKRFGSDQVAGLNELVLDFAFPALLFVGIVRAPRATLFAEFPFVLGLLVATVGVFSVVALLSLFVQRHTIGAAALQALAVSCSNAGFAGVPVLTPLFGASSLLSIAIAALIFNVTVVPLAVTMLEYDAQRSAGGKMRNLAAVIRQSVFGSLTKPYVLAPMLAAILVLLDVRIPKEIQNMLYLIGSATGGVSLFVAGLILAAFRVTLTPEIFGNVGWKMIVQPLFMVLLVAALAIAKPLGAQAILICSFGSAVVSPMLAVRYKVYEAEAASTLLLTTFAMVVVVPLAIVLTK
jgi:malonate transporter and related proteins